MSSTGSKRSATTRVSSPREAAERGLQRQEHVVLVGPLAEARVAPLSALLGHRHRVEREALAGEGPRVPSGTGTEPFLFCQDPLARALEQG